MPATCRDIIDIIEAAAPPCMAEKWDNTGLQLGHPDKQVKKVMVAIDLLEEVAREAVEKQVDMIVTHHPFILKPVKSIREDHFTGKVASMLIRNGISLYCAHTNLDIAPGGINDMLAEKLELGDTRVLAETVKEYYNKIVVYVPAGHEDRVRDAMADAGAGWIGNYSHCTFQTQGTGTFKPADGTNPYIGTRGILEKVEEYRLETIVPREITSRVIDAVKDVHPYEEVAYDIFRLENRREGFGLGRIGVLDKEMSLKEFAGRVKELLGLEYVTVSGDLNKAISKVALCGGSGGSLIQQAVARGADVYVTGDIKYHQAHQALSLDMAIVDAGHYGTEKFSADILMGYIIQGARNKGKDIEVIKSCINVDPFIAL